jgi:hypothetical protein
MEAVANEKVWGRTLSLYSAATSVPGRLPMRGRSRVLLDGRRAPPRGVPAAAAAAATALCKTRGVISCVCWITVAARRRRIGWWP